MLTSMDDILNTLDYFDITFGFVICGAIVQFVSFDALVSKF